MRGGRRVMDRPIFAPVPRTPFRRLSPHANALVLNRVHAASAPEVLLRLVQATGVVGFLRR